MALQLRVCIDVENLEAGIAFYRDALGLTPGRMLGQSWVEMLGAPAPVDLLAEPAGTTPSPRSKTVRDYGRHWTPVHLDEKKWGRLAILADPFGNGFCLLEYRGRGYDELIGGGG